MVWFDVLFPSLMIVAPAAFLGLWCLWTGAHGMRRTLVATLAVLSGFGLSGLVFGVSNGLHRSLWGMGGFWVLILGFAVPDLRRHFNGLPEVPRGASLETRRLELFRGAFVWPPVAWAVIVTAAVLRGVESGWAYVGPAVGLLSLVVLRLFLRYSVLEPETLGGPDPEALARRYESFRRRRVATMYWMFVVLALAVSAGPLLVHAGAWFGALAGTLIGIWGALFGTWADAQRYLLRRQLSGAEPPGRIPA